MEKDKFMGSAEFDLTSLEFNKSQEVTLDLQDAGDEDLIRFVTIIARMTTDLWHWPATTIMYIFFISVVMKQRLHIWGQHFIYSQFLYNSFTQYDHLKNGFLSKYKYIQNTYYLKAHVNCLLV